MTAGLEADALYPNLYNHQFQASINKADTESAIVDVLMARNVDWIIFDEHWGTVDKRLLIDNISETIAQMGSIVSSSFTKAAFVCN